MKQVSEGSKLWFAIWHEKSGWTYKIEKRTERPLSWSDGGFESRDTAEMAMNEKIKGIEGMK